MKAFPPILNEAAQEYLWLLSHDYPQKACLKLVGDKFGLAGEFRQVLYRGVAPAETAQSRQLKIGRPGRGDRVLVDTYNALFTICNYLLGKHVFISNDGMLRDAGEMRGRIVNKEQFDRSVELLLDLLQKWQGVAFVHYLDEPVSHSGQLSVLLEKGMAGRGIKGRAFVVKNPDRMLMNERSEAICTSDGAIIDHYQGKVVDLPRILLEENFQAKFPGLIQ